MSSSIPQLYPSILHAPSPPRASPGVFLVKDMSVHTTKVELDSCVRNLSFVQQPPALATNESRLDVSEWGKLRSSPFHQSDRFDGKVVRPNPRRVVSAMAVAALDVLKPLRQWKRCANSSKYTCAPSEACDERDSRAVDPPLLRRLTNSHFVCSCASHPSAADNETNDEILDIFLSKNSRGEPAAIGRSPPYFCGSPPCRVGNPHVRDVKFAQENPLARDTKSVHQNQHAKEMKFRPFTGDAKLSMKPVAEAAASPRTSPYIRVEGFDCSSSHMVEYTCRDSRCRVSAFV